MKNKFVCPLKTFLLKVYGQRVAQFIEKYPITLIFYFPEFPDFYIVIYHVIYFRKYKFLVILYHNKHEIKIIQHHPCQI